MSMLAAIALNAGFPMVKAILERKIGDKNGALVTDVIGAIATRVGAKPEDLDKIATDSPGKIIDAMRQVEPMTPELISLYTSGLQHQFEMLQVEMAEGGWKAAWRPAGMWFILVLWAYQIIGLHVANAVWKIALPAAPWENLITFTAMYMGLYMGGHTIKDVVANLAGAKK